MAFTPISGEHAILEVVFGLSFTRAFAAGEIDGVIKQHGRWKAHLPRVSRSSSFQVMFGDGPPPPEIQVPASGGVSFERVKPDGTLDWRLRVDQNTIFVNCLSYTRWGEVWPTAKRYIEEVCAVFRDDIDVQTATLQYIDVFEWRDDVAGYDASLLFKADSQPALAAARSTVPLWHLHQGWFRAGIPPEFCRFLERVHVDAVQDVEQVPIIKIDTYIQAQLNEPMDMPVAMDWLEGIFEELHARQKVLLSEALTPEMSARIDLNVV